MSQLGLGLSFREGRTISIYGSWVSKGTHKCWWLCHYDRAHEILSWPDLSHPTSAQSWLCAQVLAPQQPGSCFLALGTGPQEQCHHQAKSRVRPHRGCVEEKPRSQGHEVIPE